MSYYKFTLFVCALLINICFSQVLLVKNLNPQSSVSLGDIVNVTLEYESTNQKVNPQLLKDFVGKRLGDTLYVTNVEDDILSVVVAPNQRPTSEESRYVFKLIGFDIKKTDMEILDEVVVQDVDYNYNNSTFNKNLIFLLIFLGLALVIIIFFRKYMNRKKNLKELEKSRESKLQILKNAEVRQDFEYIFKMRREIKDFSYYDFRKYERFIEHLNKIQYRQDWSQEEYQTLKKVYEEFLNTVRIKSGI